MDRLTDIARIILPVLLMLLIGVLCRKKRLIDRTGLEALKTVAVNIGLPAVLLHTFAAAEYSLATLIVPLIMFLVCILAWALGKMLGKRLRMNSRFVPFLTTGFEAGMLGYALFELLYGSERLVDFARIDLGQVLFVFTLYKVLLGLNGKEKVDIGGLLREMAFSPIILAIAAGVLMGVTGLYQALIPSGICVIFDASTDFIAAPTSAIILLTIGYDLVLADIPWRETGKVVALRYGIMLALGAAFICLMKLLWPKVNLTAAIIVMFILPPPFVLPVFADDMDQRVYVSSTLSLSTLVAIVGFAVIAASRIG